MTLIYFIIGFMVYFISMVVILMIPYRKWKGDSEYDGKNTFGDFMGFLFKDANGVFTVGFIPILNTFAILVLVLHVILYSIYRLIRNIKIK